MNMHKINCNFVATRPVVIMSSAPAPPSPLLHCGRHCLVPLVKYWPVHFTDCNKKFLVSLEATELRFSWILSWLEFFVPIISYLSIQIIFKKSLIFMDSILMTPHQALSFLLKARDIRVKSLVFQLHCSNECIWILQNLIVISDKNH